MSLQRKWRGSCIRQFLNSKPDSLTYLEVHSHVREEEKGWGENRERGMRIERDTRLQRTESDRGKNIERWRDRRRVSWVLICWLQAVDLVSESIVTLLWINASQRVQLWFLGCTDRIFDSRAVLLISAESSVLSPFWCVCVLTFATYQVPRSCFYQQNGAIFGKWNHFAVPHNFKELDEVRIGFRSGRGC